MICSTQLGGSRVLAGRPPAASHAAARPCLIGGRPSRQIAGSRARSQRNRDNNGGRTWDDPHQTSPPHGAAEQPPAGGASFQAHQPHDSVHTSDFSSLATSDLEFGADAITGSTLETPQQEARWRERQHEKAERLHQADIAREAYEDQEAAQGIARLVLDSLRGDDPGVGDALFMSEGDVREAREEARRELVKDESTAEEREERYAGILEAIEELAADERMSPDAARLTVSGSGEEPETDFDVIRHTVDELGEGEEAAELIMRSYQGRNLEAEALDTMDPSDTTGMPHPGDKYLRPQAVPARSPPLPPGAARLHHLHSGPDFERHRALPLPRARGGGSSGQGQHTEHTQHTQQQTEGRFGGRGGPVAAAVPAAAAAAAGGGAAAGGWLPPAPPAGVGEDVDSLLRGTRAQHDPVGLSSPEEQQGPASSRGYEASSEGDDQIGLGAAAGEAGGSGAPAEASDDQIGFDEQEALRGADAMYYAEGDRHAPAAEPVPVNNETLPPPPSNTAQGDEQGEVFDVERDALQGGDAMFYYQSAGGGGRRRRSAEEALRSGGVWGALRSTDEQHSSFRRAMETPSAERKRPGSGRANGKGGSSPAAGGPSAPDRRGQAPAAAATGAAAPAERDGSGPAGTTGGVLESRDELHSSFHRAMAEAAAAEEAARSAAAAETARRYAAEAAGKRRAGSASAAAAQGAQPAQPAPSKGSAAAAGATDGSLVGAEGGRGEGILSALRRRQEEHSGAQRSLAGLGARAKGGRGSQEPPPPASLGRVLEVAAGRAAVAGLGSAAVSELLTQQSVMSQLLGRFEGSRQIEYAIPLAQSAALGVVVAVVLLTAAEHWASRSGASPSWRPLGLSPATQVWLGRGAMALFALLLAYETMHSNRPAFGTLFYLWF